MDSNDFITVDEILADVLGTTNDENMRKKNKGWYVSQIQQALEDLAFDTFFDERVWDVRYPSNNVLPLDKGMFNVRHIYLYNGQCGSMNAKANVHWKKNLSLARDGESFAAHQMTSGESDIDFIYPRTASIPGKLYMAEIQNGNIMFSPNCSAKEWVRIIANGMGCDIGDVPFIPRILRQATKDYAVYRFFRDMKNKDRRDHIGAYQESERDLYGNRNGRGYMGSWGEAESRIKSMNTWEKNEMKEYLGRINS